MINKGLKDKWLILPIIILSLNLIIRLYWTFINLKAYPFDKTSDAGNHIIYLFFLVKNGFYNLVPNYWDGFILFSKYLPGWYFFALPFYYITRDVIIATFFALLCAFFLAFIFILILGKFMKISFMKRVGFFLLVFASPVILDYLEIARYPELLAWIFFIPFFSLILCYKNQILDKKFLIIIPLYSLIILTHVYTLVVSSFLLISLFLIKSFKEKLIIIGSFLLSIILTSFVWYKFLIFTLSNYSKYKSSFELLDIGSFWSYNTLILIAFLVIFYVYYRTCENKQRELLFYSPLIILSLLILARLIPFIPIINSFPIMPYNVFFLFLTFYLFFNLNFKSVPHLIRRAVPILLVIFSFMIFVFSFMRVDYNPPEPTTLQKDLFSIVPDIEGRYLFIANKGMQVVPAYNNAIPEIYSTKIMDYATMNYNLSTPFGTTFPGGIVPQEMGEIFETMYGCTGPLEECPDKKEPPNCEALREIVISQDVKSLIAAKEDCNFLVSCGYKEKITKKEVCLFIV